MPNPAASPSTPTGALWMLCRQCVQTSPATAPITINIEIETKVVLFASVPLTDEPWMQLERGSVVEAVHGEVHAHG